MLIRQQDSTANRVDINRINNASVMYDSTIDQFIADNAIGNVGQWCLTTDWYNRWVEQHQVYYPYYLPSPEDKTEKAFNVAKALQKDGFLRITKVEDFIALIELIKGSM